MVSTKNIKLAISDPARVLYYLLSKIYVFFLRSKNIHIKGKLTITSLPILLISKKASLIFGDNVTLNSRNKNYHVNMHSRVKIVADQDDAKITIGKNTRIHGSCIHAYKSISIGDNCLIAANCHIIDNNGHQLCFENVESRINSTGISKAVVIGNNVWLGMNTVVLPGVTIGEGSVISANSVVCNDIPAMVIAGGVPAKIIKKCF